MNEFALNVTNLLNLTPKHGTSTVVCAKKEKKMRKPSIPLHILLIVFYLLTLAGMVWWVVEWGKS